MSDDLLAKALHLHRNGRLRQALGFYQKALQADPSSPDVLHLTGVALHQAGRSERSAELVRAAIRLKPDSAVFHNNLGIILRDQRMFSGALAAFEAAVRLNPLHVEALQNIARIHMLKRRPEQAIEPARTALIRRPDASETLIVLSNADRLVEGDEVAERRLKWALVVDPFRVDTLLKRGSLRAASEHEAKVELARDDFVRAGCLDPGAIDPVLFLGYWHLARGSFEEADVLFRRVLALNEAHPSGHAGRAEVALARGDASEAARHSARAVEQPGIDPHSRFRHGVHLLAMGKIEDGWRDYDYIYRKPGAVRRNGLPARWDGEDLTGKRLLVCAEQGVGDELLFAAHLREAVAAAREVILECDPRAISLLQRSFPATWVHAYERDKRGGRPVQFYDWIPARRWPDAHIEAGRLFAHFHRSVEQADAGAHAWLIPDTNRRTEMRSWLDTFGPGPKIGVAWQSKTMTPYRKPHYPGLTEIAPLLSVPGARFVSLQYGEGWREELEVSGLPVAVKDGLDTTDDLEGVAALVSELDLVIAPSSTLVWIACGTGRPIWMLYNHPIFLNLGLDRFPGFPTLRGFPKPLAEPWPKAIGAARSALIEWLAQHPEG